MKKRFIINGYVLLLLFIIIIVLGLDHDIDL